MAKKAIFTKNRRLGTHNPEVWWKLPSIRLLPTFESTLKLEKVDLLTLGSNFEIRGAERQRNLCHSKNILFHHRFP